jgi:hypothetical protein
LSSENEGTSRGIIIMKSKETKKDAKKGKEKMLSGKFWYDPMCGPIRP